MAKHSNPPVPPDQLPFTTLAQLADDLQEAVTPRQMLELGLSYLTADPTFNDAVLYTLAVRWLGLLRDEEWEQAEQMKIPSAWKTVFAAQKEPGVIFATLARDLSGDAEHDRRLLIAVAARLLAGHFGVNAPSARASDLPSDRKRENA
jgi:hypothetical protein